jgi:acetamidase/formamidase
MTLHEIPLERRTLHGHFSVDLASVLTIDSGDTIAFSCLDAGWHVEPGRKFEPRDAELDAGHPLIGPVVVRGARAGQTLEVAIGRVVPGTWGWCAAGNWSTPLNEQLGLVRDGVLLRWTLDVGAGLGRDERGREVDLAPFLGVLGPIAWTPEAWITFGFDEDLDEAAAAAVDAMLELMGREHGLERADALALASLVVDLRVTQLVNGVVGVHALLRHDALRFTRIA